MTTTQLFVVMGVSGCGKTTVGKLLAERLQSQVSEQTYINNDTYVYVTVFLSMFKFCDADQIHPKENIEKMRKGIPLNDDDRGPWLKALNLQLQE